MSIFDLITANEIVAYWELLSQDMPPYFGETLFPNDKQLGLKLEWLKGANGLPVVLRPSAYDVKAIPRPRIGFTKLEAQMPFFKESKTVDEELRQQLNMVLATGNQNYIEVIVEKIFNDEMSLLKGAAAQRERMRMSMLTTGAISIEGNGQAYDYDYGMPADHKKTVTKSWSDSTATILGDIKAGIEKIQEDTGVTVTNAVCSSKVMGYFRINNEIKGTLLAQSNGVGYLSDAKIKSYIKDELDLTINIDDKRFKDEKEKVQRFIADDVFCMYPDGKLGNTWFGTTPEESDLMASAVANVRITDTGVAVTTTKHTDPVQVDTKVSMICLPDFPTADQVFVYDVIKES